MRLTHREGRTQAQELNQQIRDGWADRGLKAINQQQSLMDRTVEAIKEKFGKDHFSLQFIKLSREENFELNRQKQGKARERQLQQQYLKDPDAIVATAVRLLDSPDWAEVGCGLAVLTGRRLNEVVRTAEFESKDQWVVTFRGALKRRGEDVPLVFDIPTLTTARRVIEATAKLRQITPADADESKLKDASNRHFADLVPVPGAEQTIYTHLWRSVFACIACFWYCPKHCDDLLFKAHILGHFETLPTDEQQGSQLRKRLETFASDRHYRLYEIDDDLIKQHNGKRKGIKLGYGGVKPLDAFVAAMPENQPTPQARKQISSIRAWKDDFDRVGDLLSRFEGKNQQDKVAAWIDWSIAQMGESSARAECEPLLTPIEEASDRHLEREAIAASASSSELETEAETAVEAEQITTESTPAAPTATPPTEQSPSSGLESAIRELVDSMNVFMQFQMQQSAFAQPIQAAQPASSTRAQPTTKAVSKSRTAPASLQANTDLSDRTTKDTGEAPKARGRQRSEADEILASRAIDAMIAHNNQPNLSHDLKWFMTNNAIKNVTGSNNQRAIARVLEARAEEIQAHHALHGLQANHNDRHKKKRKIAEVITLSELQPE